jgi:hypothetical protein
VTRLKVFHFPLLLVLVIWTAWITQVFGDGAASWTKDLRTIDYPARVTENFSKTFGSPPTSLVFADPDHVVMTFISADPGSPSEQAGRPDSFRLRLHAVVLESKSGEVDIKRDWPTPNPKDGVIAGHDGKIVVRTGDKLTLYDTTLKSLRETDTGLDRRAGERLFSVFSSPSGRFLLLEFTPGVQTEYSWMNADTLQKVHSFSENLTPSSISDEEIAGWKRDASPEIGFVIRKPNAPGRVLPLSKYKSDRVVFVNQDTLAVETGHSPMPLVRTDGKLIESIAPVTHDFFSRVTPSAEGRRFAFTGSKIRNTSETLSPHQTWEYVQRVNVYDMPTHTFVGDVKVSHSARNQDFPLALSSNGSMLALLDGESLKLYRFPLAAESHP